MGLKEIGEKIDDAIDAVKSAVDPRFEITYSRARDLFYISSRDRNNYRPRYWLGVEKILGAATAEQIAKAEAGGIFGKPVVEFVVREPGAEPVTYCRQALSFTFWSVDSGACEPIFHRRRAVEGLCQLLWLAQAETVGRVNSNS